MLPRESLKVRSYEIAGNVYFLVIFEFSKFSRRSTMLCERGTLSEPLKSRGHVPPVSPVPPGSYVHVYICANGSKTICESSPYHRHVPVECGSGKNF